MLPHLGSDALLLAASAAAALLTCFAATCVAALLVPCAVLVARARLLAAALVRHVWTLPGTPIGHRFTSLPRMAFVLGRRVLGLGGASKVIIHKMLWIKILEETKDP
jgi:hypothetical protein